MWPTWTYFVHVEDLDGDGLELVQSVALELASAVRTVRHDAASAQVSAQARRSSYGGGGGAAAAAVGKANSTSTQNPPVVSEEGGLGVARPLFAFSLVLADETDLNFRTSDRPK